jgi:hypothetical protein
MNSRNNSDVLHAEASLESVLMFNVMNLETVERGAVGSNTHDNLHKMSCAKAETVCTPQGAHPL